MPNLFTLDLISTANYDDGKHEDILAFIVQRFCMVLCGKVHGKNSRQTKWEIFVFEGRRAQPGANNKTSPPVMPTGS